MTENDGNDKNYPQTSQVRKFSRICLHHPYLKCDRSKQPESCQDEEDSWFLQGTLRAVSPELLDLASHLPHCSIECSFIFIAIYIAFWISEREKMIVLSGLTWHLLFLSTTPPPAGWCWWKSLFFLQRIPIIFLPTTSTCDQILNDLSSNYFYMWKIFKESRTSSSWKSLTWSPATFMPQVLQCQGTYTLHLIAVVLTLEYFKNILEV